MKVTVLARRLVWLVYSVCLCGGPAAAAEPSELVSLEPQTIFVQGLYRSNLHPIAFEWMAGKDAQQRDSGVDFHDATLAPDGTYWLVGDAYGHAVFGGQYIAPGRGTGMREGVVLHLDSTGRLLYGRRFGGAESVSLARVAVGADGIVRIVGTYQRDVFLADRSFAKAQGAADLITDADVGADAESVEVRSAFVLAMESSGTLRWTAGISNGARAFVPTLWAAGSETCLIHVSMQANAKAQCLDGAGRTARANDLGSLAILASSRRPDGSMALVGRVFNPRGSTGDPGKAPPIFQVDLLPDLRLGPKTMLTSIASARVLRTHLVATRDATYVAIATPGPTAGKTTLVRLNPGKAAKSVILEYGGFGLTANLDELHLDAAGALVANFRIYDPALRVAITNDPNYSVRLLVTLDENLAFRSSERLLDPVMNRVRFPIAGWPIRMSDSPGTLARLKLPQGTSPWR